MTTTETRLLTELLAEVRGLRADLHGRQRGRRQSETRKRHQQLRRLAAATSGSPWQVATALALMLAGKCDAPEGLEGVLAKLQRDPATPRSVRGIYNALAAEATERILLQWPGVR